MRTFCPQHSNTYEAEATSQQHTAGRFCLTDMCLPKITFPPHSSPQPDVLADYSPNIADGLCNPAGDTSSIWSHGQGSKGARLAATTYAGLSQVQGCSTVQNTASVRAGVFSSEARANCSRQVQPEAFMRQLHCTEVLTDLPPSLSCSAEITSTGIELVPAHRSARDDGRMAHRRYSNSADTVRRQSLRLLTPAAAQRCAGCCVRPVCKQIGRDASLGVTGG